MILCEECQSYLAYKCQSESCNWQGLVGVSIPLTDEEALSFLACPVHGLMKTVAQRLNVSEIVERSRPKSRNRR